MAIVNHEVGAKGPGREVVHAAGAVRHVPHHDGVGLREPAQKTLISAVTCTPHARPRLIVMVIDTRSALGVARWRRRMERDQSHHRLAPRGEYLTALSVSDRLIACRSDTLLLLPIKSQ